VEGGEKMWTGEIGGERSLEAEEKIGQKVRELKIGMEKKTQDRTFSWARHCWFKDLVGWAKKKGIKKGR
jgi:hypothetical protein